MGIWGRFDPNKHHGKCHPDLSETTLLGSRTHPKQVYQTLSETVRKAFCIGCWGIVWGAIRNRKDLFPALVSDRSPRSETPSFLTVSDRPVSELVSHVRQTCLDGSVSEKLHSQHARLECSEGVSDRTLWELWGQSEQVAGQLASIKVSLVLETFAEFTSHEDLSETAV